MLDNVHALKNQSHYYVKKDDVFSIHKNKPKGVSKNKELKTRYIIYMKNHKFNATLVDGYNEENIKLFFDIEINPSFVIMKESKKQKSIFVILIITTILYLLIGGIFTKVSRFLFPMISLNFYFTLYFLLKYKLLPIRKKIYLKINFKCLIILLSAIIQFLLIFTYKKIINIDKLFLYSSIFYLFTFSIIFYLLKRYNATKIIISFLCITYLFFSIGTINMINNEFSKKNYEIITLEVISKRKTIGKHISHYAIVNYAGKNRTLLLNKYSYDKITIGKENKFIVERGILGISYLYIDYNQF